MKVSTAFSMALQIIALEILRRCGSGLCESFPGVSKHNKPSCISSVDHFENALYVPPNQWNGDPTSLIPPWADLKLSHRGQRFAKTQMAGILFSMFWGLQMIFADPQTRNALLSTGRSSTVKDATERYTGTGGHVVLWLKSPISFRNTSNNWILESLRKVRTVHDQAGLKMLLDARNGKYPPNDEGLPYDKERWSAFLGDLYESNIPLNNRLPDVRLSEKGLHPFNQLHLAVVQWAFLGSSVANPDGVNVFRTTKEGRDAYAHLWGILGYSQGLRDEYNLGLACNVTQLTQDFFKRFMLPTLFNMSHGSKFLLDVMNDVISQGIGFIDPEFSLRGILRAFVGIDNPRRMNARKVSYSSKGMVDPTTIVNWSMVNNTLPSWFIPPMVVLNKGAFGVANTVTKFFIDEWIAKYWFVK